MRTKFKETGGLHNGRRPQAPTSITIFFIFVPNFSNFRGKKLEILPKTKVVSIFSSHIAKIHQIKKRINELGSRPGV
jgi:hypothetical protein